MQKIYKTPLERYREKKQKKLEKYLGYKKKPRLSLRKTAKPEKDDKR